LNIRASSVAFNFILAIFPAIIFLFTLLAYIPLTVFRRSCLTLCVSFLPSSTYVVVRETFEDVITQQRGGLLSLTVISALFFSTNGISALIDGFNATYTLPTALSSDAAGSIPSIMLILVSITIVAVALIVFGGLGMRFLLEFGLIKGLGVVIVVNVLRWLVVLMLLFSAVTVLYVYGPARTTRWDSFPQDQHWPPLSSSSPRSDSAFSLRISVPKQIIWLHRYSARGDALDADQQHRAAHRVRANASIEPPSSRTLRTRSAPSTYHWRRQLPKATRKRLLRKSSICRCGRC
jgi:hypothetical protein